MLVFSSGTAKTGNSGALMLGTGGAHGGRGGLVSGDRRHRHVVGRRGASWPRARAPPTAAAAWRCSSGEGAATSSGDVFLRTANAGTSGVSGMLVFSSGTSSGGASGDVLIGSGAATGGTGGAVSVTVGGRQLRVRRGAMTPCGARARCRRAAP